MADPRQMDLYSFGTFRARVSEDGLVEGTSIFDGSTAYVRIDADPERLLIDYCIGATPDALAARIFVRVSPGELTGDGDNACVMTLVALRANGMDDARWERLQVSHAFELTLIKSVLETGYDHRRIETPR